MRKIYILLIIILTSLLTSCFDYLEVNSYYYASSLGLEYDNKKSEYKVFLYIINNLNLGTIQTSVAEKESIAYTAKATNISLEKALYEIFENSDIRIDLRHLRTIIFHESFINKQNINHFCNIIRNDINFYFNFSIYITKDKIEEIYKVNNFTETSAYMTLLTMTNNYDNYNLKYFPNLINDLELDFITYKFPLISCKKEIFEKNNQEYITIFLSGYACFNKDHQVIFFDDLNYSGVIYLNNRTNFQISIKEENVSYNINKYNISYYLKNTDFFINIKLTGFCLKNIQNKTELLERELKKELLKIYDAACQNDIDIFNINYYLKYEKNSLNYQTVNLKFNFEISIN